MNCLQLMAKSLQKRGVAGLTPRPSVVGVMPVEKERHSLEDGRRVTSASARDAPHIRRARTLSPLRSNVATITEQHQPQLGSAIGSGHLSRRALRALAVQLYLQEQWPSHIAQVYLALDNDGLSDPQVIKYILSIIRAENLGVGSSGLTHTELARRFAAFLGVHDSTLKKAKPVPANQVLMDWCDASSPWTPLARGVSCSSRVRISTSNNEGYSEGIA